MKAPADAITYVAAGNAEQPYNRRIIAWSMYDWADHGFITTTIVTFFPPYSIAIAAPALLEAGKLSSDKAAMTLASDNASNVFSLAVALALFIAAIVAPILGTYADITGRRKRLLVVVTAVGSLLASFMIMLTTGLWLLGLVLYAGTQVAVNIALGMNSSLLPHVSRPDDLNRVSSMAYALGYVGGGPLLTANTALFIFADKLGIDSGTAVRIAFFTTGIWWLLFTLPLALVVPESQATPLTHANKITTIDAHSYANLNRVGVNPRINTVYFIIGLPPQIGRIDGGTNKITSTVSAGIHLADIGVNPSSNLVYVTDESNNAIMVMRDTQP